MDICAKIGVFRIVYNRSHNTAFRARDPEQIALMPGGGVVFLGCDMRITSEVVDRFWERVEARGPNECWELSGCRNTGGYGLIRCNGARTSTHRLSWAIHNGPIPKGMHVLHTCDNPSCANPNHLWLGTNADNVADRERKNRNNPPSGEKHGSAKISADDVREIRRLSKAGKSLRSIARKYPIGRTQVGHIVNRKRWVHVD